MVLTVLQIILSIVIIAVVLLQSRSSGFSTVFGGGTFQTARRGSEKYLHYLTIVLIIVFCALSLLRVFI